MQEDNNNNFEAALESELDKLKEETTVGKTRKSEVTGKDVTDYVDNAQLARDIRDYNNTTKEREAKGLKRLPMPNSVGKRIMMMIAGMASRYNFRNYTYVDEMAGDAMVAAVRAVHKFDYEKYSENGKQPNAYGFLNFCAWQAMCTRIKSEKVQQKLKEDMMIDPSFEFFDQMEGDENIQISRDGSLDVYWGGKLDETSSNY